MASRQNASRAQHSVPRRQRQRGAFAVMFVPLLLVMIGFWALALDIGQAYSRKADLHGIAKAAALAAARQLDGTPEGLTAAKNAASTAVASLRYQNFGSGSAFTWKDEALSFGKSAERSGTWIPAAGAGASSTQAAELFFVRVDTTGLDPAVGTIRTFFVKLFDRSLATVQLSDSAIAGRTSVGAMPIGVCAMSPDMAAARPASGSSGVELSELVQYGFRRGVSYDLMKLNPNGTTPVRFAINPVADPGTTTPGFTMSSLEPFVCSGSMWVRRLNGGTIKVSELPDTSPLAALRSALNTRFDTYSNTLCNPGGASPDINIKSYAYDQAGVVKWMSPDKGSAAVATTTGRGKLEPVFNLSTPPSSPGDYGPLWAYAKAAKAPSPVDSPEPAGGFATFSPSDWPTLYPSGPTSSSYPTTSPAPYFSSTSNFYLAPRVANRPMAVPHRRLLNIPLLSCSPSAPSGSNVEATVLGIGKFFMTVPATDDSLIAEFAGLLPQKSLPGHVELFP